MFVCIGRISHKGEYDAIMKSCNDISSFVIDEKVSQEEHNDKENNV